MNKTSTQEKITKIRDLLRQNNLNAYIVPGTDSHLDEYIPAAFKRREYITQFKGSSGDLVVTLHDAGLWTDGRYFLQAETELKGSSVVLYKFGEKDVPFWDDWLVKNLASHSRVGVDPALLSHKQGENLKQKLSAKRIKLLLLEKNLVDVLWVDRPPCPAGLVTAHEKRFCGEPATSKLALLRKEMAEHNADLLVLSKLDEIAWLFNIRGTDIEYNPLAFAYALLTPTQSLLFLKRQPSAELFLPTETTNFDYQNFKTKLIASLADKNRIWVDPEFTSVWITEIIKTHKRPRASLLLKASPASLGKAIKNATEIQGFINAHLRDGVAMVKFFTWLSSSYQAGNITEIIAQNKLEEFRRQQDLFVYNSFPTISAFKEHGAVIHYQANSLTDAILKPDGLYLIDSGAQYRDGTTDITRTLCLGEPHELQKWHYTLVLKSHIRCLTALFPQDTRGIQLDSIAREVLWKNLLDYAHGTGHGIGSFLNVHEGPQALSSSRGLTVPLKPGMFLSIEPGYYREGAYGIRIENLVYVKQYCSFEKINYLFFENVTLCPYDLKLIDSTQLNSEEKKFINSYHSQVQTSLSPHLTTGEKRWLAEACRELP